MVKPSKPSRPSPTRKTETPAGFKTEEDLRLELVFGSAVTTQVEVAKALGVSGAFICDVIHQRRAVTEKLAHAMGYERVVLFRKLAGKGTDR